GWALHRACRDGQCRPSARFRAGHPELKRAGMEGAELLRLYGTDEPLPDVVRLQAGRLAVEVAGGTVRSVCWDGVEVLRGIDYPIRDADWGTHGQVTLDESREADESGFRYVRKFAAAEGAIEGELSVTGQDTSLELL